MYEAENDWSNAVKSYRLLADSSSEEKWKNAAQERILVLQEMLTQSAAKIANE